MIDFTHYQLLYFYGKYCINFSDCDIRFFNKMSMRVIIDFFKCSCQLFCEVLSNSIRGSQLHSIFNRSDCCWSNNCSFFQFLLVPHVNNQKNLRWFGPWWIPRSLSLSTTSANCPNSCSFKVSCLWRSWLAPSSSCGSRLGKRDNH